MEKEGYQKGEINYDTELDFFGDKKMKFYLPHSCDSWIIGDIDNAKLLIKEIQELIKQND